MNFAFSHPAFINFFKLFLFFLWNLTRPKPDVLVPKPLSFPPVSRPNLTARHQGPYRHRVSGLRDNNGSIDNASPVMGGPRRCAKSKSDRRKALRSAAEKTAVVRGQTEQSNVIRYGRVHIEYTVRARHCYTVRVYVLLGSLQLNKKKKRK